MGETAVPRGVSICAEVGGPRVIRVKGQLALGPFDASSRSTLFFAIAAEGTIDLNEQADGLVVIGLNLCRALEKRGVAILVSEQPQITAANYWLKNPEEVERFLGELIAGLPA